MNQNDAENFNGQMRDFGETASQLVNYILLVSAGILSVTIGAFLAKPPPLSPNGPRPIRSAAPACSSTSWR